MTSTRRQALTILVALGALAGALLFGGAAAQAEVTHKYLYTISEVPAQGPHGEPIANPGQIQFPVGLAFDSGELYLDEFSSGTQLDEFDASTGAFVQQFALLPYSANQSVAVGHVTGETEVYDTAANGQEGVVEVYSSTGAIQGHWTGADTPAKKFGCFGCSSLAGVAVDNSANPLTKGDVYVSAPEQGVVDVFEPKAGGGERYLRQLTGPEPGVPFQGPYGVAVDQQNGDVAVIDGNAVDVFEPTALGGYALVRKITGTPRGPFASHPFAVAVDGGNGEIFVVPSGNNEVDQFDSEGVYDGRLISAAAAGVAVDPTSGEVFLTNAGGTGGVNAFGPNLVIPDVTTTAASNITHGGATLNGTVDPDGAGEATCRFEWGTSTSFGNVAACEPEGVAEGDAPVPVHATLTGLQPDTTYHYWLQATNRADGLSNPGEASQDGEFTTPGPGVEEESVSNVAATSATLDASIDPNDAPTTYYFQYGTSTAYGTDAPAPPGASIGAGKGEEEVARHLQGLSPGTVYHYRVVAVSELAGGEVEVVEGADQTFTTQPVGFAFALPDDRQWEMVSSPEKRGAEIQTNGSSAMQASVNGDAITYISNAPMEANPLGYSERAQSLSLRGPEGWVARNISPPHVAATGASIGEGQEYRLFSEDLSLSVVHPFAGFDPLLSPEASESTAYLRTDYLNGNVDEPCLAASMSCYRPLVTGKPGYANVPAGTVFGEQEPGEEHECLEVVIFCGPEIVGASPDLSHILLKSSVPLALGGGNLYEWTAGKLTSVGDASGGNAGVISPRHGISDDGSRVVFGAESQPELLMFDAATGETVRLDSVQGGTGEAPERLAPTIQAASSDGSKVFFTDDQQLTASSHQNNGNSDLYECAMTEAAGKLGCQLSNLTPEGTSGQANVRGAILGAGEDGSYVYFVADGVLAEGAVPGKCTSGQAGDETCNLYVRHDGVTKLVAVLSQEDAPDWAAPPEQTARVSSNGQWLAFMSQRDLTGYVTRDAITGELDEEVYLYNAVTGKLVCASCDPTGARPIGLKSGADSNTGQPPIVGTEGWSGGVAANIPHWKHNTLSAGFYQSRYLSDSGRLFFNSKDALVPQDVNGAEDVYEYEPPEVGNCTTSSATYSERSAGCIDLISSGTSGEESAFLDASGNGGDVFFVTAAKLAPQDYDTALDIYDARECTAASQCYPVPASAPPACDTGDACKASPTPQPAIYGSPSSATFSGAGNITPSASAPVQAKSLSRAQELTRALKACRARRKARGRATCERQARARYGSAKSSRASKASGRDRG
jgi:hypothetical protein